MWQAAFDRRLHRPDEVGHTRVFALTAFGASLVVAGRSTPHALPSIADVATIAESPSRWCGNGELHRLVQQLGTAPAHWLLG